MNHAPFISIAISLLSRFAEISGIPFGILLRAPFALLDAGTMLLLLKLLRDNRHRFAIAACYWLHPLAMIFSAYHGNIDSAVAFFLVLTLYLISKNRTIGAGAAIGASLWVKLPGVLAIPVFFFALEGWRKRLLFLAAIGIVGISTYIPALLKDPAIVYKNVFGYEGQVIKTTTNIRAWGTQNLFAPFIFRLPAESREKVTKPITWLLIESGSISLALIVILSWLRRHRNGIDQTAANIAACYTILYGFSNFWSFQYFAWSIPFWFFAPPAFLIGATALSTGYIYSLYSFLCGNFWLLGKWDFAGRPNWPDIVIIFRDLAFLFFFLSACAFLINSVFAQFRPLLKGKK
jgi:Gpi18-like mannosyltransferase